MEESIVYLFLISPANNLVQTIECPRSNEEDVCSVHSNNRVSLPLTSVFVHNVNGGSLEDLEQSLLHPLSTHVSEVVKAGNTADLVHFIQKYNT